MKQGKIIQTAQGWVVYNHEEIVMHGWCYSFRNNAVMKFGTFENSYSNECKKAIASETKVDGLLPLDRQQIEEQINGYDFEQEILNIDKTVIRGFTKEHTKIEWYQTVKDSLIIGFNKHAELTKDKMFTLNELKEAFAMGRLYHSDNYDGWKTFIQSLQQPKQYDVTWEEEEVSNCNWGFGLDEPRILGFKPVLTNGFLHIKIVK